MVKILTKKEGGVLNRVHHLLCRGSSSPGEGSDVSDGVGLTKNEWSVRPIVATLLKNLMEFAVSLNGGGGGKIVVIAFSSFDFDKYYYGKLDRI